MTLEEDIQIVNLPKKGTFKLVQLKLDDHPVMLCGPLVDCHKFILRDYLESQNIPIQSFRQDSKKLITLEGPRYIVVGMGVCNIDLEVKYFSLPYGESQDYRIGPSEDFEKRLRLQFADWNFQFH